VANSALKTCEETVTGKVKPSYQLLFVVYAPPGTKGGKSSSMVDYGEGSTMGSSTSTASSFRSGISISANVGGGIFAPATISAGMDMAVTIADSTSLDVKKSTSWDIKVQGPDKHGIDHDLDLYYLCLNPVLAISIVNGQHLTWGYDAAAVPLEIQYVYGAWLKNPASMPPGLRTRLANAGLTHSDYAQILSANPFTSGTTIDPNRFLPTSHTVPYEPPVAASAPVPTMTYLQKNEVTQSSGIKVDKEYGVNFSVEAGDDKFLGVFKVSLKVGGNLKWTNSSTSGMSTLSSQSATVTISGPSFGYQGPTDVLVYWDTLFNTFMFAFPTTPAIATGRVTNHAGEAVAGKEVVLTSAGHTFRTFTNTKGDYRFYGPAEGAGILRVGGTTIHAAVGAGAPKVDLKL
jgi:hypothetical protein